MQYEVAEDRLHPSDWRVEAVDYENDGAVHVAIFSGPNAKARADEYAAWKSETAAQALAGVSRS